MSRLSSRSPWGPRWPLFNLMPIRINLLAEAQALEELRRREPVKRAIWAGVIICAGVLAWCSWLQLRAMRAKNELTRIEAEMASDNKQYQVVEANRKKLSDIEHKLGSLQKM